MRASVEEGRGLSADEPHGRRGGVLGPRPRRPGLVLVRVGVGIARRVRVARAVALPVVHGLVLVRLVRLLDDARRLVVRDGRRHDQRGGRDAHLAAAAQLRVDEARVVRGPVPDAVLLVRGQVGERLAPHERDGVVERHGFAHFRRARVRARERGGEVRAARRVAGRRASRALYAGRVAARARRGRFLGPRVDVLEDGVGRAVARAVGGRLGGARGGRSRRARGHGGGMARGGLGRRRLVVVLHVVYVGLS
mmetsp:Transcript_1512/g.4514  ORF Transcript_1512/g.4514 Transcript_1512/m.4514 type:complete len:251 (-) Transcript_1512:219-971(-)